MNCVHVNENNIVDNIILIDNFSFIEQNFPEQVNDWIIIYPEISPTYGVSGQIGDTYNRQLKIFIAPQPFPSWALDQFYRWQAPVPYPVPEGSPDVYWWDEELLQWVKYAN